jgi:hypothetical protein
VTAVLPRDIQFSVFIFAVQGISKRCMFPFFLTGHFPLIMIELWEDACRSNELSLGSIFSGVTFFWTLSNVRSVQLIYTSIDSS